MNETENIEREACRKAFEFDLIDNWMYVESDFALDDNGLYADSELYFAWECAWASWQASRAIPEGSAVQWWLATIDMHGNPTLTDGAHSDRTGADRAAYLINTMVLGAGKRYAVARVELSTPKPNSDGVNHAAVAQCRRAALG